MILLNRSTWQLAVISGILVGLSYLHMRLNFFVYFGFIPILHCWILNDKWDNLKSGYIFGITYNIISNYWIGTNSGAEFYVVILSLIFAVLYLSIFWGIAGFVYGKIKTDYNNFIALPFLIVTLEWIRSFGPLGFPWGNLALTQVDYLLLLQLIDFTGPYFLSFIIIIINLVVYKSLVKKDFFLKNLKIIVLLPIIIIAFGYIRIKTLKYLNHNINIAVIQPNIDPNEKWDYNTRKLTISFMDSLYNKAISLNPDIILFPETALPTYLRINNNIRNNIQQKVNQSGIPALIGTIDRDFDSLGNKIYYNSAIYFSPNEQFAMYNKIHLVPFAEYDLVPNFLSPLEKLNLNINRGIFKKGDNFTLFKWENINFADLICYESSFPRYAREFVKKGANILMIQANDGWLGKSAGPYQHFAHARLRAIENRIPIVRCGNTGISGVILPTGEIKIQIPIDEEVVFKEKISLNNSGTFYTYYGDVFAAISFVIFLFLGPVNCLKK
tara:strand:- start:1102 stop:2595 length:1494 start_codon:yes stop_codon:yes gene_type:complete